MAEKIKKRALIILPLIMASLIAPLALLSSHLSFGAELNLLAPLPEPVLSGLPSWTGGRAFPCLSEKP